MEITITLSISENGSVTYQSDSKTVRLVPGDNQISITLKKVTSDGTKTDTTDSTETGDNTDSSETDGKTDSGGTSGGQTSSTGTITLSAPEEKSKTYITLTVVITGNDNINQVSCIKGEVAESDISSVFENEKESPVIQDSVDTIKWTFTIKATNEEANGTYTVAAKDTSGNVISKTIEITNFGFTAPAAIDESTITGSYQESDSEESESRILLGWTNPADEDFDHVEITYISNNRKTDSESSAVVTVSGESGTQSTYSLSDIEPDKEYYTFYLVSVDKLGNKSKAVTCKVRVSQFVTIQSVKISGSEEETWRSDSTVFIDGRSLSLDSYIICDHEVTRKEFKDIMGTDPSTADADGNSNNNPVNYTNWYMAIAYCNKRSIKEGLDPCYTVSSVTDWENLEYSSIPTTDDDAWNNASCVFAKSGYRLPTEAEWEYAARGGEAYAYSGSDDIAEVAWYEGNSDKKTHEVRQLKPNGYDLYDMTGNVWEWCWDFYGTITTETLATGPETGTFRMRRGGSWYNIVKYCGVTISKDEFSNEPYKQYSSYGFRVVRTLAE